ncbi:MAG: hypothetical protein K1W22_05225 [Lachnospiraceae bacterium]
MDELRQDKIKQAREETNEVFERHGLNLTEIEIVTRAENVAAKVMMAKKELESDAKKMFKEQTQTPQEKIKQITSKWLPAIVGTVAVILSIISMLFK